MKKFVKIIRTCVNCRYLEIVNEGQIVEGLQDTAYISFKCNIFNFEGREVFSFPKSDKKVVIEKQSDNCPFWEEWIKPSSEKENLQGSDAKSMSEPDEY